MKLAVLSDVHVLGPGESDRAHAIRHDLGASATAVHRYWRRALHRTRGRFWNWHPEAREECFHRALDEIAAFGPDWVIANGDYGGDAQGVGLSDAHTFESAHRVVDLIRRTFPARAHFVFGDHELGKYSTELRRGGIRLDSLTRGEEQLGLHSFWHEVDGDFHLLGINSTLITLDLFLPEAVPAEVPRWQEYRRAHLEEVTSGFAGLPPSARAILFCHDPGALGFLHAIPEVRARLPQIERTVLGHLHEPRLMHLNRLLGRLPRFTPRYPVARIIAHSSRGARHWKAFRPLVCPSTFGTGHHITGGILFLETDADGRLTVRRHRVVC